MSVFLFQASLNTSLLGNLVSIVQTFLLYVLSSIGVQVFGKTLGSLNHCSKFSLSSNSQISFSKSLILFSLSNNFSYSDFINSKSFVSSLYFGSDLLFLFSFLTFISGLFVFSFLFKSRLVQHIQS
jgi:hypothetical protein